MKIDKNVLLQKISSRKFWTMLAGLVGSVLMVLNFDAGSIEQITGILVGAGALVSYMLVEGATDIARAKNPNPVEIIVGNVVAEKEADLNE